MPIDVENKRIDRIVGNISMPESTQRISRFRLPVRMLVAAVFAILPTDVRSQEIQNGTRVSGELSVPSILTEYLSKGPFSTIENPKEPMTESSCLKILITSDGTVVAHSLPFMDESGWIANQREHSLKTNFAQGPEPAVSTDITPCQGSGFRLVDENNLAFIGSNWHVYEGTSEEVERLMVSSFKADIAFIPQDDICQMDDTVSLPISTLPPADVTNKTLSQYTLTLHGFGGDLYTIKGKPVEITMQYDFAGKAETVNLFALLVPHEKLVHYNQLKGMSGSPLAIEGTNCVAGIFHRHYVMNGTSLLVFSGPDEIRKAFFTASALEEHEKKLAQEPHFESTSKGK